MHEGLVADEVSAPHGVGIVPTEFRIPRQARLGAVRLVVSDIERSRAYYRGILGFRVLWDSGSACALGAADGGEPMIELVEEPGASPARRRGRLGLYHFAILLPDRADLGSLLTHLSAVGELVGGADHAVSEAIYLQDPDGFGVEVYADRPRREWRKRGAELIMESRTLDRAGLVAAAGEARWHGVPAGASIGHLHLHVGELEEAVEFYHLGLGFDLTSWSYPGALFFAADGYHHHLGVNTWAGAEALPASHGEARLLQWELVLPTPDDVAETAVNLQRSGQPVDVWVGGWAATDPWDNHLRCRSRTAARSSQSGRAQSPDERRRDRPGMAVPVLRAWAPRATGG
jgi:catechol 2,3-dioxygenase